MTFPNQPVDYSGPKPRTSGMAIASLVLSIVGIPLTCVGIGLLLTITGVILGFVSLSKINRRPQELGGKGFALSGIIVGAVGGLLAVPLLVAIMLPSLGRARELSNRSYCAANLRGLMQSCNIYAADNADYFPIVMPPASNTYTFAGGVSTGTSDQDTAVATYYSSVRAREGSVTGNLWLMVIKSYVSPKQFLCKSDPFASSTPANITSGSNFLNDLISDKQNSYSMAYPWTNFSRDNVAPWWRSITDSSLPLMADMAPMAGTGSPPANPSGPASNFKVWNSPNHGRDGQNVAFSDAHAEWMRRPDIGQNSDNIWTSGGAAGTDPNGTAIDPRGGQLPLGYVGGTRTSPAAGLGLPFDIVMVPIRDVNSGTTR